jgi:hypothetical protein
VGQRFGLALQHIFWYTFGHSVSRRGDQRGEEVDMPGDKVRENRLRRMAQRQGLRLEKSRRRDPRAFDYGGYMLIKDDGNFAVYGSSPMAYSASLDDIEAVLQQRQSARP